MRWTSGCVHAGAVYVIGSKTLRRLWQTAHWIHQTWTAHAALLETSKTFQSLLRIIIYCKVWLFHLYQLINEHKEIFLKAVANSSHQTYSDNFCNNFLSINKWRCLLICNWSFVANSVAFTVFFFSVPFLTYANRWGKVDKTLEVTLTHNTRLQTIPDDEGHFSLSNAEMVAMAAAPLIWLSECSILTLQEPFPGSSAPWTSRRRWALSPLTSTSGTRRWDTVTFTSHC